jgi:hypothetical protein
MEPRSHVTNTDRKPEAGWHDPLCDGRGWPENIHPHVVSVIRWIHAEYVVMPAAGLAAGSSRIQPLCPAGLGTPAETSRP